MSRLTIAAALIAFLSVSDAQAGEVYCFYPAGDGTTYITPVFKSDDSRDLLSSLYSQSLGNAGLSICVTEEDEKDVPNAWQAFVDGLRAQHIPVVIQAMPSG